MFTTSSMTLAFLPFGGSIGSGEMIIIGVIAVLLFGKRLPEVGRSLGKSLVEFKKGMAGIESEIRSATSFDVNAPVTPRRSTSTPTYGEEADRSEPAAPRFEPPPALAGASESSGSVPRYEAPKFEPPAEESQLS
jgi:sec-independent protein translocase protein TatA